MKKAGLLAGAGMIIVLGGLIGGQKSVREEEGSVLTVLNPARPVPAPGVPRDILFEEELAIGSPDGPDEYVFGEVVRFAVDGTGCVYVLDRRARSVRKFGPDGKFLITLGRPGQGPGEYSFPEEIRSLPDGRIVVFEAESQRYSVFSADGDVLGGGKFTKLMFPPYFGFGNGNFIAMNVQREQDRSSFIVGVFDPECELVTELHRTETGAEIASPSADDLQARAQRLADVMSRAAFRTRPVIALTRDEDIVFGDSERYEIRFFTPGGVLEKIVRTELPRLPVEEKDRRDYLDLWVPRDISNWNSWDKAFQNRIKKAIRFPDRKPAFIDILPMRDGGLLVVRDGFFNSNALVDVFDPEGRFIIEKKLDFPIRDGVCCGGKLYTLHEDESGFLSVKRYGYRLVGGSQSAS